MGIESGKCFNATPSNVSFFNGSVLQRIIPVPVRYFLFRDENEKLGLTLLATLYRCTQYEQVKRVAVKEVVEGSHAEKLSIKSGWTIIKIGNHCLPHKSYKKPSTHLIKYIQREATASINGFVDFHFI